MWKRGWFLIILSIQPFLCQKADANLQNHVFEEIFGQDGKVEKIGESRNVYNHISSSTEDLVKLFHHESLLAEKLKDVGAAKPYLKEINQR